MHRSARLRILLLAWMVAVSHVVLISHAAAHYEPAVEHCALCVSQAHPLAAIPAVEAPPSTQVLAHTLCPTIVVRAAAAVPTRSYLQRAPPYPSS